jgi:hypothetical protein
MLIDIFFGTTLIFVYGTFGLLVYTFSKQCCQKHDKKIYNPNIQTYIQMRKVFREIESHSHKLLIK